MKTFNSESAECDHFISICSAVKASHVLISASGYVQLSGLHNALSMIQSGKRLRRLHDYPAAAINILLWLSPEILEQVNYIVLYNYLPSVIRFIF